MLNLVLGNKFVQALTVLIGLQSALFYTASHGDAKFPAKPLVDFPRELPGWRSMGDSVVDDDTRGVLKADDVLSRFFAPSAMLTVNHMTKEEREGAIAGAQELFIAYFSTQQQGQSPHSPKNCLPGAGWQAVDVGEITLPIAGMAKPITINKYIITKGTSQSLVLYWYQSHGRVVANEFAAKFYLVADSIRYHRSDTALVRVVTPVIHDDLKGALDGATNFVQAVFPVVYKFLPM